MSAEAVAQASGANAPLEGIDARTRRVLRFSIGVTLGSGFAYLIGFELPFLVPILIAMLLASPAPRPTLRAATAFLGPILAAAVLGLAGLGLMVSVVRRWRRSPAWRRRDG